MCLPCLDIYMHGFPSLFPPPSPLTHARMHRGEVAALFKHHSAPITSVEWHPQDSTVFASSGADDQVRGCTQLAFHPTEGEYIASSSAAKYEASRRTHTAVIPPGRRKRGELHTPGLFYLSVLHVRKSLRRTHVSITSHSCSLEQISC